MCVVVGIISRSIRYRYAYQTKLTLYKRARAHKSNTAWVWVGGARVLVFCVGKSHACMAAKCCTVIHVDVPR